MGKTTVKLDKPIYLAMSILDLSKTLMYEFHYDYVKPKWEDRLSSYSRTTTAYATKFRRTTFTKTSRTTSTNGTTRVTTTKIMPADYARAKTKKL